MIRFESFASSSSGNLYAVHGSGGSLLIDPGIDPKKIRIALKHDFSRMSGAICGHRHGDHSKGLKWLSTFGVDVFANHDTISALELSGHRVHLMKSGYQVEVGPFSIMPFDLEHDAPCLGFMIATDGQKALYINDSFYVRHTFPSVQIIAIECNYSERTLAPNLDPAVKKRLFKSHFSLENVIKFLRATDLQRVVEIHLLHCSDHNADESLFLDEVRRATGKQVFVAGKG